MVTLAQDAFVRHPAALVLKLREVLGKKALVCAKPGVDVLAVVEPALPRVHEAAAVAARGKDAEDAVEPAVHGAESRQRGGRGVQEIRLHAGRNVELRIRRSAREVGNDEVARVGVLPRGEAVVDLHRVLALGEDEDVLVQHVGEGLVHDEDHVHPRGLFRLCVARLPGRGLVTVKALGLFYLICREMVAEIVNEAELVVHRGQVVGLRRLEGVVEVIGAVDEGHRAHEQGGAEQDARDAQEHAASFRRPLGLFERQQQAEDYKGRRHDDEAADLEPGQAHVVAACGVRGLLDEGDIARDEGFSADGELHSVYEGHDAHNEPGGGRAPEGVAEGKGESPRQQGDGQPVQQQNERLVQHLAQHRKHGDGVRPERKKRHRHGAGEAEQDGWNKAKRPGISFQDGSVILSVSSR